MSELDIMILIVKSYFKNLSDAEVEKVASKMLEIGLGVEETQKQIHKCLKKLAEGGN